jgi:hypothetical protein
MTETLQLNVSAGGRQDRKAEVNGNGDHSGYRIIPILQDNKVHSNLYRLATDRGVEQRRDETYERNLGDIPTAPHIHNQNAPLLHCRLHDVPTTLWPSPQMPPL